MSRPCRVCGGFGEYMFPCVDSRGCIGVMCAHCLAQVAGFHQNGNGGKTCDECGRDYVPGQVDHYIWHGEHINLCRPCYMRILTSGRR